MPTVQKPLPTLLFCLLMDAIGYASFAVPGIGEFTDILWAPLSAYIFYNSFGGKLGTYGALFNFTEEILPFTDFIPTFTIVWLWKYFSEKKLSPGKFTM